MSIEVTMPRLSDTMEQGTIIRWNAKEGDSVASGDIIADIETDKATMEMQVFDDGVIAKIVVEEGRQVPVGTLIAMIAEEGEDPGDVSPQATTVAPAAEPAQAEASPAPPEADAPGVVVDPSAATSSAASPEPTPEPAPAPQPVATDPASIKATPVARRLAQEHDIDLATIQGSGPGGRIIKRDILAAVESAQANVGSAQTHIETAAPLAIPESTPTPIAMPALEGHDVPVSPMRQAIARRLVQSKQSIPHYQVTMRFEMDSLMSLRATLNRQLEPEGVKLSVNDFIVRACALSMKEHPMFNASWASENIVVHGHVNIGVAVSLPEERGGGLVVATIRDADTKSLRTLSAESRALAMKARDKGLTIEEMADSTFTVSNLGMFGVDELTAIINPPNSAILACGAAVEQPVVRDHALTVGWEMAATLSLDHRVIDGAMAARYLQTLKGMVEEPMRLLV